MEDEGRGKKSGGDTAKSDDELRLRRKYSTASGYAFSILLFSRVNTENV